MHKRLKILIADDEANIRRLVSNMLGGEYIVFKAGDGMEAIDIARSQKPDLILMDIMMPNMDGYSACHAIKKDAETASIPVVMVTALGQALNMKLAKQIGADGYVVKPFGLKSLQSVIAGLL